MTTFELTIFTVFVVILGYILGFMTGFIVKRHKHDGRVIVNQTNPDEDFMRLELDVDTVADILKKDRLILKMVNKH